MKRTHKLGLASFLKWAFALLSILLALPIISAVMSIGTKLHQWQAWAEWAFYGSIALVLGGIFIKLVWPVFLKPSWPASMESCKASQLKEVAQRQISRGPITEPGHALFQSEQSCLKALEDLQDEHALRQGLMKLKDTREKLIRACIQRHAVQAGAATAISRNDLLDALMMLTLSARLVRDIVEISGLRPSLRQTLGLYAKVARASFYAYYLDDLSDQAVTGLSSMLGGSLEGVPIVGGLAKATSNGLFNALIITRIGFIAEQLVWGHEPSLKQLGKRSLIFAKDSTADLIKALNSSLMGAGSSALSGLTRIFRSKKETP